MRILITGGTGMVGSHAAAALQRDGHELRFLARNPARVASVTSPLGLHAPEVIAGDVTDAAAVERAIDGCDAVLHSAALLTFDRARTPEMERTNVDGTRHILEAAIARQLDPIMVVSSVQALWQPGAGELTPQDPVAKPRDPYSRTKAAAETLAREAQDRGAPVVLLYPGAVWGPDNPTLGDQITTIFAMVRWGYFVSVEGGIPIIDTRDLALAATRAMTPGRGPRRYMLAGRYCSHDTLRELISHLRGRRLARLPVPASVLRALGRLCDVLRDRLGVDTGAVSAEAMCIATSALRGDSQRSIAELGLTFRPVEETIAAQMRWMVDAGHLSPRAAGALAAPRAPTSARAPFPRNG